MLSAEDCNRLTSAQITGPYINYHPHMIISQPNSTHDMNKSIPAAPTGMYQQNSGAIPGPAPPHHQPGIGGPSSTPTMVQGQQRMNQGHNIQNMAPNFPQRNNPTLTTMSRPPLAAGIVHHGAPQGSQAYPQISMLSSQGHPQLMHQIFQMPVYQQRPMQFQTVPPQLQQQYFPAYYNSPSPQNPAFYSLPHIPACAPAVNNLPPPSQTVPVKREKKVLAIINPNTGENVMDNVMGSDLSRDSSRSASVHTSREDSRISGSDPDVCSTFAAQVAAVATKTDSENKGVGDAPSQLIQQQSEIREDSGNGEIPTVCDQYIEKDEENFSTSVSDSLPSSEFKEECVEPVENESYSFVNHDDKIPELSPPLDRGDEETIASLVSEMAQDEVTNCASENETVLNITEEPVPEQVISNAHVTNQLTENLSSMTALKTEKPTEGKKNKGKKKKETINKKGESKEGTEMDAFLVSDVDITAQDVSPSIAAPVAPTASHEESPSVEKCDDIDDIPPPTELSVTVAPSEAEDITSIEKEIVSDEESEVSQEIPTTNDVEKPSVVLKYNYKEDQWSPLNPEGKKHYDREFLIQMQAQSVCLKKPNNLPNIEVIKDKAQVHKLSDINRAPIPPMQRSVYSDPFIPQFARGGGVQRPSPHNISRRSQQGRDPKPKKVISFSSSLNQTVKLHESSNAWKPQSVKPEESDKNSQNEEVYKKVRGILNKLTPQKFDTLVKQVKDLEINTEERLNGVIDLVFEKAIDEPNFSVPYANMCKQLALLKVPIADQEGNQCVNFRKLLLTKCQREFEQDRSDELHRDEKLKQIENATDEKEKKQLQEEYEEEERKNRRRQLGNIRFIGELFKLGMLTEMIMHECVKKLLRQGDEDSLECLCRLLTTIGKELETKKERMSQEEFNAKKSVMNEYISVMQRIVDKRQTSSRVRFMLQDVIDLRKNSWKPRRTDDNPKTIDQIHKEAERELHEQQQMLQNMPFSSKRPPEDNRKRSTGRNMSFEQDGGWITTTNKASKVNFDPQKLTLSKPLESDNITLGPSRAFNSWGRGSSGGNRGNVEPEKSSTVHANKYSLLAESSMPPQSLEARRNSQRSAASSRESSRGRNNQLPLQSIRKTPSTSKERETVLETVSRLTRPSQPEQKPVEPKVPNMSTVNGKETTASLKGPELSEDEIEKKTKPIMDEFLHNADFDEAVKCITEIASPATIHLVITEAVNHVLERSSHARYLLGQLLHCMVQSKIITLEQYNKGLKTILELVDDYALDIPLIWDYLADIIHPILERGDIPLTFLNEVLKPCIPSLTAGKLVVSILRKEIVSKGVQRIGTLWRESELTWSLFLPSSVDIKEFIKTHEVEYTVDPTIVQPKQEALNGAEIQKRLDYYLKSDSQNNEQIIDWIESHIGANRVTDPIFIRALVTSVFENAISGSVEKCELNLEKLKSRLPLIQKFVTHKVEAELPTLYALQALLVRLKQPKGLLNLIFNTLYDEEIIGEEVFCMWESSKDPAEQEGKGVAVSSVASFFTWLKETDNETSNDEG